MLIATSIVIACGCDDPTISNGSGAEVTGRVTLEGKPVGIGRILFYGRDRPTDPIFLDLKPDGSFQSLNVPLGLVKVAVQTRPYAHLGKLKEAALAGKMKASPGMGGPPIPAGDWRPVPARYESSNTSGLEYEITPGSNVINIDLRSK